MSFKDLDPDALRRVDQLIAPKGPLPISRSTFWSWVKSGKLPRGLRLSDRVTCWRVGDIQEILQRGFDEKEDEDGVNR